MISAGAEDASLLFALRGEKDRVVGDGPQRRGRRVLRGFRRAAKLGEHARQDAKADGRLIGPPFFRSAGHEAAQSGERRPFGRIAPEVFQILGKMSQRHLERLRGQREHFLGQLQAPARCQSCVCDQGRSAGRSIDQREHLLFAQFEALGDGTEQRR